MLPHLISDIVFTAISAAVSADLTCFIHPDDISLEEKITAFRNGETASVGRGGECSMVGSWSDRVRVQRVCQECDEKHQFNFDSAIYNTAFLESHVIRSQNLLKWIVFLLVGKLTAVCGNIYCRDPFQRSNDTTEQADERLNCFMNDACTRGAYLSCLTELQGLQESDIFAVCKKEQKARVPVALRCSAG